MLSRAFFGFSDLDAFVDNTARFRPSLRFAVSDDCQPFHSESELARVEEPQIRCPYLSVPSVRWHVT